MITPVPAAYAYKMMILFIPSTGSKNTIVVTLIASQGEYVALLVCLLVVSSWYLIFLRFFQHRFVSRPLEGTEKNESSEPESASSRRAESTPPHTRSSSPIASPGNRKTLVEAVSGLDRPTMDFDMYFSEKSSIVTISQVKEIIQWLPKSVANNAWTLSYSLRRDGASLESLMALCAVTDRGGRPVHSSYILLIEDSWGYIFGSLA